MQKQIVILLLDRSGRIGRGPFWLGVALLTAVSLVVGLVPLVGQWIALTALWPWFCLLSKRRRDMGVGPHAIVLALGPLALSGLTAAVMSLMLATAAGTMLVLPVVGLLGSVALLAALAGLAAVIWFGVAPGRTEPGC